MKKNEQTLQEQFEALQLRNKIRFNGFYEELLAVFMAYEKSKFKY